MKEGWVQAIDVGRRTAAVARVVVVSALIATAFGATAATEAEATKIQKCKDANGNPLATDKSDPRCFNAPLTPDQQAAVEDQKRRAEEAYRACKTEQRGLQTLLSRYPDKQRHDAARRGALAQIETSMAASQKRMAQLLESRKRYLEEAEFYPSGNLPAKLRRDIDGNSALIAAQAQAIESQKEDAARKNAFYDEELSKLKKLWLPQRGDTRTCVAPPS